MCGLRCEKSWRVCLHLQSAQNVKFKLLSIIRGVSTVNYYLPTFRTPSPYQWRTQKISRGVFQITEKTGKRSEPFQLCVGGGGVLSLSPPPPKSF